MPRGLRWIVAGLLGLAALVALAVAALYAVTAVRFRRPYRIADSPVRAAASPTRLGGWTEADIFRAIREERPDGSIIDPAKMSWVRSSRMTDDEIRAVWLYERSLPPRPAP